MAGALLFCTDIQLLSDAMRERGTADSRKQRCGGVATGDSNYAGAYIRPCAIN